MSRGGAGKRDPTNEIRRSDRTKSSVRKKHETRKETLKSSVRECVSCRLASNAAPRGTP